MSVTIYTKDKLIEILIEQVKKNTEAFDGVKAALEKINDQNILHAQGENSRNDVVKKMVDGNEKFYKIVTYLLILLVVTLVVLAGAEKALKFLPPTL